MFKNLTDLSYKRNTKEAIGFYLAYLLLVAIAAMIAGGGLGIATGNNTFDYGYKVGNVVAIVSCLLLSFVILNKKNLLSNFGFVLVALLSGVVAMFGGGLLGLIPTAYLSTR